MFDEPEVELELSCDRPSFDLCCILSLITSDEKVLQISSGYAHYRTATTGRYQLKLATTCVTLRKGDRLRLSIAGADYPAYPVNPGTGEDPVSTPKDVRRRDHDCGLARPVPAVTAPAACRARLPNCCCRNIGPTRFTPQHHPYGLGPSRPRSALDQRRRSNERPLRRLRERYGTRRAGPQRRAHSPLQPDRYGISECPLIASLKVLTYSQPTRLRLMHQSKRAASVAAKPRPAGSRRSPQSRQASNARSLALAASCLSSLQTHFKLLNICGLRRQAPAGERWSTLVRVGPWLRRMVGTPPLSAIIAGG